MQPTPKDFDVATSSSTGAGKAQPTALEVPVTVNGARTVEGSDKREPFSESTQTVLVFGNGAVIRLASSVTPGQLLFLTNDKTKKEVVCQVLKSKNYSNVSGYVELEFTEPVPRFWGVRFQESAAKPANAPTPVAAKPAAPPVSAVVPALPRVQAPTPTASLPKPPANLAPVVPPAAVLPKAPAPPTSIGDANATSSVPEIKSVPAAPKAPTVSPAPAVLLGVSTQAVDALKRESARLQEQLSAMNFQAQEKVAPAGTPKPPSDASAKVIDIARSQTPAKVLAPASSMPSSTGLGADEVKIPSWLEPLARNAATPAQNELAREEDEREIEFEVQDVSAPATLQEIVASAPVESSSELSAGETILQESAAAKGNNKVILIGAIAAGILVLAAGGTWYARQSSSRTPENTAATSTASSSVAQSARRDVPAAASSASNFDSAPANATPVASTPISSQPTTPTAQPLRGASDKNAAAELSAYKKLAEPQPQPVQPAPKRPSLGSVKLATPALVRRTGGNAPGEADLAPSLSGSVAPSGDAMGGGLAGNSSKPAAPSTPLPVGGDVKQARLISSTPPLYPPLAKTQHVEGAVRVDALVDENGRVTAAKVVSGPTLLQQAAIDAIRQWKYQPATLDGKPVPMHLTVTLQFKLQ